MSLKFKIASLFCLLLFLSIGGLTAVLMWKEKAILLDNILYLPLEDIARITGIAFTMDEAGGTVTVAMPAAG